MQQPETSKAMDCFKLAEVERVETFKSPDLSSCTLARESEKRSGGMRITRNLNFYVDPKIISKQEKAPPTTDMELAEMKFQNVCDKFKETGEIQSGGKMRIRAEANCQIDPMSLSEAINLQFDEIQFHPVPVGRTFKDNPALLNKSSMNRLRLIIYLGTISGALPWRWGNGTKDTIDCWEGGLLKIWWLQWSLVVCQTVCLTVFQLWVFLESTQGRVSSYREVFMSSTLVYWYLFALLYRLIVYMSQEKMRCYINSMLRFNSEHAEKYLLHLDGHKQGGKIVMNLSIPLTCCQIGSSLSFFIIFHGQPWYLTSYLPYKDWYWLIPGALHDFIVVSSDITIYLLMAWIIVAHGITVAFWLQESHNSNSTNFTSEELRRSHRAIGIHRALSVLNASFNNCMAGLPIPMLKLTIFWGALISGYVMVRSMNHRFIDEFPSILIYPVGIINCVATAFGFISMSAQVNELGTSFVESWSYNSDKNLRRILMSCSTLKVWVGRLYYVSVGTTATFFAIIVDQITFCIVTFP